MTSTDDILNNYRAKIEREMASYNYSGSKADKFSRSYEEFREGMSPEYTRYEKWCKAFGNLFVIKLSKKDNDRIQREIDIAHLNITSSEVVVFSLMTMLMVLIGGSLAITSGWLLFLDNPNFGNYPFILLFLIFFLSITLFYYASRSPTRLAIKWRLKASSQMVPAILYIVIYMKHTSNFEKAVAFAAEHLKEPLALDFRKVFWDVEVGKYSTIKSSVDAYLETWRDYSIEFIEAFHLIESSLFEPSEGRRVVILEKSLQVILDGVYDKMLKYTHEVKAPLTNIYMLGIVLPTLTIAILPLASTMLGGAIEWYHMMFAFNILIPLIVIYMTEDVMMQRPGGYGETDLLEKNPLYPKYKSREHYVKGFLLSLPLLFIGSIPFLLRYTPLPELLGISRDYTWSELGLSFLGEVNAFGIIDPLTGGLYGPSGTLSLVLSLFIPLGIATIFIVAYKGKTKEILETRNKYKEVETEFTSSLFQLGNRIGDGIPAEIAFAKVLESTKGTETEGFFRIVNENISSLGMSIEKALFDPKRGAVIFYPSELIATSMKILVESVKKGLEVAARSLMSISEYVKNIKKINDRLNDLLADITSDMKSNMTFLAPLLSGIVVGLAGMISLIIASLGQKFVDNPDLDVSGVGNVANLIGSGGIFQITQMIPTYWLQIVVGIYLIEIVFILTSTLVIIKSGRDKLLSTAETGINLKRTMVLYFIICLASIVGLTLVGTFALRGLGA